MEDKSKGKEIMQELDKTIIFTCHLLQSIKSIDEISMREYASVTGALAELTEARAHLNKEEPQQSYIPYHDAGKE